MTKFLVVEDDPWSLQLVCDILEIGGHAYATAADVPQARAQLETPGIDAVLLDIHIPGGGGEQLLREIRAAERIKAMPVIALTASAMTGDRERFLRAGFNGYMSKPIDVRTFCATVEKMISS